MGWGNVNPKEIKVKFSFEMIMEARFVDCYQSTGMPINLLIHLYNKYLLCNH